MRVLPFRIFALAAASLGVSLLRGYAADKRQVTGREAEAIALAINDVKAEHRKTPKLFDDPKDYSVTWELKGSEFWVSFAPNLSPTNRLELGGGWYYVVSLDRMKILRIVPMK